MSQTLFRTHVYVALTFFISLFLFLPYIVSAQVTPGHTDNFITTWDTTQPGVSASNQIRIPHTTGTYNYHLYWENTASSTMNGTTTISGLNAASSPTITFPEPGIYRVEIIGTFPQIYFINTGDRQKILQVNQWGNNVWTNMQNAFYGCINLRIPATDAPDLSNVTTMFRMLFFTSEDAELAQFNDPINHWDVSNVVNLGSVFTNNRSFNQPLSNWNVAKATTLSSMFNNTSFNQDISTWNTASSTSMGYMFASTPFNQPLNSWDVSSATTMIAMFRDNTSFNQPLNSWDVSKVTDFSQMFSGSAFNQPLNSWDTVSATTMFRMFDNTIAFNQNLSSWDITSLTTMNLMLRNTTLSPQNLDATLQSWAEQAVNLNKTNIPLHIGLKTYSSVGAEAKATLESLGWTITEQYQAQYHPGPHATLIGTGTQSPLNSGAQTTSIEIKPDTNCTFLGWNDNTNTNPRVDTITDNLTLYATISCPSSGGGGTTLANRIANLEAMGKTDEANALRLQFNQSTTTSPTSTTSLSIEDTLNQVRSLLDSPLPLDPANQSKTKELLSLLMELMRALSHLLLLSATASGGEASN